MALTDESNNPIPAESFFVPTEQQELAPQKLKPEETPDRTQPDQPDSNPQESTPKESVTEPTPALTNPADENVPGKPAPAQQISTPADSVDIPKTGIAPSQQPQAEELAVVEKKAEIKTIPTPTSDPTPVPSMSNPQALAAKVIVVHRDENTMTLEISGKLHSVNITPQVRILKKGKLVTLDQVTSGQRILLLAHNFHQGTFEVISVAIGPANRRVEAAGGGHHTSNASFSQRVDDASPFFDESEPAHSLEPNVSPDR